MLTKERLLEVFKYEPETGNLLRRTSYRQFKAGRVSGNLRKDGYLHCRVDDKLMLNHRLVFLYHKGYLPTFIDHINGNRADNRIENLREATRSNNMQNRTGYGASKYKGIHFHKPNKNWIARSRKNGKGYHIGSFKNECDAAMGYNDWCYSNLTSEELQFSQLNNSELN